MTDNDLMITPPIIVVESFDIAIYSSIQAVEAHLEAVDVHDKIYTVYNSTGQLLELCTEKVVGEENFIFFKWQTTYERVFVNHQPIPGNYVDELRAKLIASLTYWNQKKAAEFTDMPFDQLLSIAVKRYMWR